MPREVSNDRVSPVLAHCGVFGRYLVKDISPQCTQSRVLVSQSEASGVTQPGAGLDNFSSPFIVDCLHSV